MRSQIKRRVYVTAGTLAGALGRRIETPVFVVGSGRCGTTLLTDVLSSHPALLGYPGEANDLWHPRTYPFDVSRVAEAPIEADPAAFTALSMSHWPPGHERTIARAFAGYRLLAGPRRRLFVKSAMISFMLPAIDRMFPDARFVHLFRNGPSVVASYMKKNYGRYRRYHVPEDEYRRRVARYWNDCLLEIGRAGRDLGLVADGRLHEFSYEDLCERPDAELDRLAGFLGIDPAAFAYDTARIESTNYKVGAWGDDPVWEEPLRLMEPAMNAHGYL